MTEAQLEHVNVTCADPDHTAKMLVNLFGWHIRWSGAAKNGGYTVHVGTDHTISRSIVLWAIWWSARTHITACPVLITSGLLCLIWNRPIKTLQP